eukprot:1813467-Amphidinium_carterae.1
MIGQGFPHSLPLVRSGLLARRDLSLLRETQDSLVRPGGLAGRGLSLLAKVRRSGKKPLLRIGEATNPGPPTLERPSGGTSFARTNIKVLTVNAGGWAPALHSLSLKLYDIVLVQETWLLEGSLRSASFQASQQ